MRVRRTVCLTALEVELQHFRYCTPSELLSLKKFVLEFLLKQLDDTNIQNYF